MPLFWNSIFSKLSFNVTIGSLKRHYRYGAIKFKKKKKNTSMELVFMELKFQNDTIGSLKCHYRPPELLLLFFNFQFVITRLSKNQVLHWNSIFRKLSFKIRDTFLISLENGPKHGIFCAKRAFAHFGHTFGVKCRRGKTKSERLLLVETYGEL